MAPLRARSRCVCADGKPCSDCEIPLFCLQLPGFFCAPPPALIVSRLFFPLIPRCVGEKNPFPGVGSKLRGRARVCESVPTEGARVCARPSSRSRCWTFAGCCGVFGFLLPGRPRFGPGRAARGRPRPDLQTEPPAGSPPRRGHARTGSAGRVSPRDVRGESLDRNAGCWRACARAP